jgi:Zn-dependent peptidase ImmA (M78 family)
MIREAAQEIAKMLDYTPATDLRKLVKRLGGKITEPTEQDENSASIIVDAEEKSFTINLQPDLFPLRERFYIAHELGHLFLHSRMEENLTAPCCGSCVQSQAELEAELEADMFARAFLMPTDAWEEAKKLYGTNSIQLAAHFMVPEPLAWQRLQLEAKAKAPAAMKEAS